MTFSVFFSHSSLLYLIALALPISLFSFVLFHLASRLLLSLARKPAITTTIQKKIIFLCSFYCCWLLLFMLLNMFNRPIENGMPRFHWNAGSFLLLFPALFFRCCCLLFVLFSLFLSAPLTPRQLSLSVCAIFPFVASQLTIIVFLLLYNQPSIHLHALLGVKSTHRHMAMMMKVRDFIKRERDSLKPQEFLLHLLKKNWI